MIKLLKSPTPQILANKADEWRDEFLRQKNAAVLTASVRFRYRHPDIKAALRQETSDKCAYCESKIPHTFPGEIEHIVPSSIIPELVVEWTNLTLVCTECNRRKLDYYNPNEPLLNPYLDDPASHLVFCGSLCFHVAGSDLGLRTRLKLELSRPELHERRVERLTYIHSMVDVWARVSDGPTKELVKREILKETSPDKEYSAAVKAFLDQLLAW